MDFPCQQLDNQQLYRLLTALVMPRPIAWISSIGPDGAANLAPYSFFTVASLAPPVLLVSQVNPRTGREKDTLRNLRERGELVIQLVSAAQAATMNATSASFPHGVSEFERCGVASLPSERVAPLRVAGAPVAFECRLASIQPYPADKPSHHLVFAEILLAHVDDAVLADARHVDPLKLDLVGRLGGTGYATTRDLVHLRRPA